MVGADKEVPRETARRVLQAAAVEAHGRPEAYVTQARVMGRADMVDLEGFKAIAEYLERKGWIAGADADYGVFTVTITGVEEAMK
jgi:hypothetical protein